MTRHRKQYVVFVHSELDDLPLTPEAFRVYCHLVRRAGNDGQAFPSFASIARHCFSWDRQNNPHASRSATPNPDSARRFVIKAIAELKSFNLVTVEKRLRENGANSSNEYVVTHVSEWINPGGSDWESPGVVIGNHQGSDWESPAIYEGTPQEGTPLLRKQTTRTREENFSQPERGQDFEEKSQPTDLVLEAEITSSSGHIQNSGLDQTDPGALQNEVQHVTTQSNYEDALQCQSALMQLKIRKGSGWDEDFVEVVRLYLNRGGHYKGIATTADAKLFCRNQWRNDPGKLLAIAESYLERAAEASNKGFSPEQCDSSFEATKCVEGGIKPVSEMTRQEWWDWVKGQKGLEWRKSVIVRVIEVGGQEVVFLTSGKQLLFSDAKNRSLDSLFSLNKQEN